MSKMLSELPPAQTASCVIVTNPFDLMGTRSLHSIEANKSIAHLLGDCGIKPEQFATGPLVTLNGIEVNPNTFMVRNINPHDVVSMVRLPHGGGGGGGKKSPLKTVLMIAVMVAGAYFAPMIAGSMGFETGTIGFQVASGVAGGIINAAGGALINALVPSPPMARDTQSWGGSGNVQAASPTYSLQPQGNVARLTQPIAAWYGRHKITPDFAANPWQDFSGNEQYLYQLYCIGQGHFDLESTLIDDTPISSFEEIDTEVIEPGGSVTLFDEDVISAPEVAGQETLSTTDGGVWIGPFNANPAETTATNIGIDVSMPRGLYYAPNTGGLSTRTITWDVEARPIDDDGVAVAPGTWSNLGSESVSMATTTPQSITYNYPVTAARYEVRLIRTDTKDTSAQAGHVLRWIGLRSHLVGTANYGDVTLLAVRMRATDNLSQRSSRMLNVIATRKLPIWDAITGWSAPVATSSIAWALADVCRATYGAKLTDARIDLAALVVLDATWAARGDEFNGGFDQGTTVWEALKKIARCGRAVPFQQGGIYRFVRDEPQTIPVAMFTPRNMTAGSFNVSYIMPSEETADAVTLEYFNPKTWKPDEVTMALADSVQDNPAKVRMIGCTNVAQGESEAFYMASANRYRRKFIKFTTELDGLIPTYMDLIGVSHDMPSWGESGDIVEWDDVGEILTLSEPVEFEPATAHVISLRKLDGGMAGPYSVEAVAGDAYKVHLLEALTMAPYTGAKKERTHFSFGPTTNSIQMARLLTVRPRKDKIEITCVGENDLVHATAA